MPAAITLFLELALKSAVLLAAAWVAVLFLHKKSAAIRHQVWSLALAAVLALPCFVTLLPSLRIPITASLFTNSVVLRTDVRASSQQPNPLPAPAATPSQPKGVLAASGMLITLLWALGAAVSLTQMFIGLTIVERMRRQAKPITLPDIEPSVELRETDAGNMPITYGLFHPVILLPSDLTQGNAERRRAVLLHELAHVRRGDIATHLLARLALALYWWHPLVWLAWRKSLRERESAADDAVLNSGAPASEYANHLLAIARSMRSPAAALAMVRPSQLEDRLAAILDSNRNRKPLRRASAIAVPLAALALLVPIAALQAKSDGAQNSQASPATQLIDQGKAALSNKNYDSATDFFNRAEAADPKTTAEATMWLAITQQRQNNFATADSIYQVALSAEPPNSPAAATVMELYATLLHDENKKEEAETMLNRAANLRKAQAEEALSSNQPSSAGVYQIGGDVKTPALELKVEPEYTDSARLARYTGTTLLSVVIGIDGVSKDIKVIRPLGFGLDEKAVEAVKKWKFKPATLYGQPVAVSAQVEVNFRLM